MWDVEVTDEFTDWWRGLDHAQREALTEPTDCETAIPAADDLYEAYLNEIRDEGLI